MANLSTTAKPRPVTFLFGDDTPTKEQQSLSIRQLDGKRTSPTDEQLFMQNVGSISYAVCVQLGYHPNAIDPTFSHFDMEVANLATEKDLRKAKQGKEVPKATGNADVLPGNGHRSRPHAAPLWHAGQPHDAKTKC